MSEPQIETTEIDPSELGVQEAPQPVRIEREDHLEYQLVGAEISKAQLLVDMYTRELQRAQGDLAQLGQKARALYSKFEEKYKVNLQLNMITDDGVVVPRPMAQRDALVRQAQSR